MKTNKTVSRGKTDPEMPYERFLAFGREALSNAELLAVILRSGTPKEPVMELARRVLRLGGGDGTSLGILHSLSLEELMAVPGIGRVKAIQLQCVLELSRRLSRELAKGSKDALVCRSASQIADVYMESMRHRQQESVFVLLLNSRYALIREEELTIGTVDASLCSPRDVFMRALKAGAAAILLMHNHPSGDPLPSEEDIRLTRRVAELGELLEIPLLDHLILGDRCYFSLKEAGILEDDAGIRPAAEKKNTAMKAASP